MQARVPMNQFYKNLVLWMVIGLIVIGLSAAIANFVIGAISGVNLGGA